MSYLYNVYSSPKKGQWGFTAVQDGAVRTAFVDGRDQQVTLETIAPIKLAPTLARLLRSGYRRETHPQYLLQTTSDGMNTGRFVLKHPDLGEGLRGEMVLFAALPPQLQMVQAVDDWEEALRGADSPDQGARSAWLAHCRQASTYVPAMPAALIAINEATIQEAKREQLAEYSHAGGPDWQLNFLREVLHVKVT